MLVAAYAFIPIIALHDDGELTAIAYASILVALHIVFVVIYFWRVKFRKLDPNNKSLCARLVGLLFCLMLLALVAGSFEDDLSKLAMELLGLCAVHSLILALLSVRVVSDEREEGEENTVQREIV